MAEQEPPPSPSRRRKKKTIIRREGDWDCMTCGDLCYAFRDRCRNCGTPKPFFGGERDAHRPIEAAPAPVPSSSSADTSNIESHGCRADNRGGRGGGRGLGRGGRGGHGGRGRGRGGPHRFRKGNLPRQGDWLCESCGDVACASRSACRCCCAPKPRDPIVIGPNGYFPEGTEDPSSADKKNSESGGGTGGQSHNNYCRYREGDWVCPGCGDVVFSYRNYCRCCGCHKPPPDQLVLVDLTAFGDTEGRDGDWVCPRCNCNVFGHSTICFCGESRPR